MTPEGYKLELPKWYDLHAHFRQGNMMSTLIADHKTMGCAGILAMPNTAPPVAKIEESKDLPYWSLETYHAMLEEAGAGDMETVIVPLYLTKDTTPAMIEAGKKKGLLKAVKYYPPHGTTGADFGRPLSEYIENGVFAAMQEAGVVLCMHGEEHNLASEGYFGRETNAEEYFYMERAPRVLEAYPNLKVVCEHLTTKVGVEFVKQAGVNVTATITPQHLLYTIGDLLQGLKYYLYCLPLLKFEEDRQALRGAVTAVGNAKFFAGTDSAPHTEKMTRCGCAAGCYTGGIAPQLYAQGFEAAGMDLSTDEGLASFEQFLCRVGPAFYDLRIPKECFKLEKTPHILRSRSDGIVQLPLGLSQEEETTLPWSVCST